MGIMNTKELKGIVCPHCGYSLRFHIECTLLLEIDDNNAPVNNSIEDLDWSLSNDIICWHCNHQAKVGDFTGMVGVVKFEEDTDLCVHPNNSPHNERYRTFKAGRLYEATIILAGGEDAEKDEYHIIFNNNTFARFVYAGFFHFYSEKW